jgi:hypothetical protein
VNAKDFVEPETRIREAPDSGGNEECDPEEKNKQRKTGVDFVMRRPNGFGLL